MGKLGTIQGQADIADQEGFLAEGTQPGQPGLGRLGVNRAVAVATAEQTYQIAATAAVAAQFPSTSGEKGAGSRERGAGSGGERAAWNSGTVDGWRGRERLY